MYHIGQVYGNIGVIVDIDKPQAFQPPVLHVMTWLGNLIEVHPYA